MDRVENDPMMPEVINGSNNGLESEAAALHRPQLEINEAEKYRNKIAYWGYFLNTVLLIVSVPIICIGIIFIMDESFLLVFDPRYMYGTAAKLICSSGIFVLLMAFVGYYAIFHRSKIMTVIYFVMLFISFVLLPLGGIYCIEFKRTLDYSLENGMINAMKHYNYKDIYDPYTYCLDKLQKEFECCGMEIQGETDESWKSWRIIQPTTFGTDTKVPPSCCKPQFRDCQHKPNDSNANLRNCFEILNKFMHTRERYMFGIGFGFPIILFVSWWCMSFILSKLIDNWKLYRCINFCQQDAGTSNDGVSISPER